MTHSSPRQLTMPVRGRWLGGVKRDSSPEMSPLLLPPWAGRTQTVFSGWPCNWCTLTARPGGGAGTDLMCILMHYINKGSPPSRNRMLGVRNDSHLDKMAEVECTADLVKQELNIPHKTQIHHNRKQFKLEWK